MKTVAALALSAALYGLWACGPSCPEFQALCPPSCINPSIDPYNCGGCGIQCPSGNLCVNGQCQLSCQPGYLACDGGCSNPLIDLENCGACGNSCPSGQRCEDAGCSVSCLKATPTVCCGVGSVCSSPKGAFCSFDVCATHNAAAPYCANTDSDPRNCGACATPCALGQSCVSGVCA